MLGVDIFIGKVDAARVGNVAVDDRDLPVVAMVHDQRHQRHHRVEGDAADAAALHLNNEIRRQPQQTSEIIVDEPDVHPRGGFPLEDGLHAVPHDAGLNDEKFQKDELFRPFEVGQQFGVHGLATGEIFRVRVLPRRVGAVFFHVAAQVFGRPFQHVGLVLLRGKVGGVSPFHLLHPGAQPLGRGLIAKGEVKRAAQQRQQPDQNDPADLVSAVFVLPDEVQHDADAQRLQQTVQPDPARGESPERPQQPRRLQKHQCDGDGGPIDDPAEKFDEWQFEHAVPLPRRPAALMMEIV